MRLTKAEFVNRMNRLEEAVRTAQTVEQATKFHIVDSPLFAITFHYMDFLMEMCDIPIANRNDNSLEYYVNELDFGRKYQHGCFWVDDQPVSLATPEELYDVLCGCWGGKE